MSPEEQSDAIAAELLADPAHAKLKEFGWGLLIVVVTALTDALANFIADHSEALQAIALAFLPSFLQPYAGGAVTGAIVALVAWLRARKLKASSKEKIAEALETPPPSDVRKFY